MSQDEISDPPFAVEGGNADLLVKLPISDLAPAAPFECQSASKQDASSARAAPHATAQTRATIPANTATGLSKEHLDRNGAGWEISRFTAVCRRLTFRAQPQIGKLATVSTTARHVGTLVGKLDFLIL